MSRVWSHALFGALVGLHVLALLHHHQVYEAAFPTLLWAALAGGLGAGVVTYESVRLNGTERP